MKNVIIGKARQDKCGILFSSHDLSDVSEIRDRVVMISNGHKVYDDAFREKKQYFVYPDPNSLKTSTGLFPDLGGQITFSDKTISFEGKALIQPVLQRPVNNGIPICDLQVHENSLYDLFKQEA